MPESQVLVPEGQNYFQIVREFAAPRALVFRCYTDPVHMVHFWGPHGSTTPVCRIDLRPGGVWRVVMRFASGSEYGYSSVYLEIVPPERIVYRDAPDDWTFGLDSLPPAQLVSTIALAEQGNRTIVTVTVRYASVQARDEHVKRGFTGMVTQGNDRLADYLKTLDLAQA